MLPSCSHQTQPWFAILIGMLGRRIFLQDMSKAVIDDVVKVLESPMNNRNQ
jgi:hypothetical protein